jgi:hypothetical protein
VAPAAAARRSRPARCCSRGAGFGQRHAAEQLAVRVVVILEAPADRRVGVAAQADHLVGTVPGGVGGGRRLGGGAVAHDHVGAAGLWVGAAARGRSGRGVGSMSACTSWAVSSKNESRALCCCFFGPGTGHLAALDEGRAKSAGRDSWAPGNRKR